MAFATYAILLLSVVVVVFSEEGPQTEEPSEEEVTQKIKPPEEEPIDEFYNYKEPLDEYNDYKPNIIYDWKHVKEAYNVKDVKFLRYLCMKVHELAGYGRVNVIDNFILDHAVIIYKNPAYFPTDTEFLQYVIEVPIPYGNQTERPQDHFFITEGLKEDCIFYLIPTNRELKAFNLDHHVCGVHRALRGAQNRTLPAAAQG